MPQVSTVPPEALPQIPSALQVEHRVIHEALLRATKAPGDIGTAARELAGRCMTTSSGKRRSRCPRSACWPRWREVSLRPRCEPCCR